MRNSPSDEGKRWYRQSAEDLKWARTLFNQNGGYHIVCFLCQQIGEKCLKAYLYSNGDEIVLGHSILKLAEKAALKNPAFSDKTHRWAVLDTYYITSRYPNGLPDGIPADAFSREMAEGALDLAQEMLEYVNSLAGFE